MKPELRASVLLRDRKCFLSDETGHICRDLWGTPHASDDLDKLTLEHVKTDLMAGRKAPDDPRNLVALCGYANVRVPSKEQRARMREYLATC